jgi:crotonobetainyl-CoA:carnitine CoA-transferase CaiB-like acyl-CoA transferase
MIGDQMMDYAMNHRSPKRHGNRDAVMAPHSVYRCAGSDEWLSIAVSNQEEWQALVRAMGGPSWAADPVYATAAGRRKDQERLDSLISQWTADKRYYEAMRLLQAEGVPAMPSFKAEDLFNDPHVRARGAVQEVDHPVLGRRMTITPPYLLTETPARIRGSAPMIGADNHYVLCELLGLTEDEVQRLANARVVY